MADNSETCVFEETASSSASPRLSTKVASTNAIEPKVKPHPRTSKMVTEAIKEMGERGGSSLFAIKKYISVIYNLDTDRQVNLIKKYLKAAVASGELVQTKGKGASGSFKLPSAKTQATNRKEAKFIETEAAAAKIGLAKKAAEKKMSKTESAKPSSSTKKSASSKLTKRESSTTLKYVKTVKGALPKSPKRNRVPSKSPRTKKLARSPTTVSNAAKPKKVDAAA